MSHRLPEKGLWHVADRRGAGEMPFDLIKLDLRGRSSGTVRARNLETRLKRIRVTGPDRFDAVYDIRGHRGTVEGVYLADGVLRLSLAGTVTARFITCAADPEAADQEVADRRPAGTLRALAGAVDAFCRPAGLSMDMARDAA